MKSSWSQLPGALESDRTIKRLFLLFLIALVLIIFRTFDDYGMTWDEDLQARYGEKLLRWYASFGQDDSATHFKDLWLYGGFFELLAEVIVRLSPLGLFETRHLVSALFAVLAFLAVFGVGLELGGARAGLLSALLLALTPLFYGHMFGNSKDAPFATAFIVGIYSMLASLKSVAGGGRLSIARIGLAIGVCAGIRVWGLALLGLLALLWFGHWTLARRVDPGRRGRLSDLVRAYLGVTLISWATMLMAWPWAALAPVTGPFRALFTNLSLHRDYEFLFRGEILTSGALPRDYAFTWLALTLPELHLLGLAAGLFIAVRWLFRAGDGAVSGRYRLFPVAWLTFVAVAPLILVAALRPYLYDGIRHLLFVVPPLCVLSGLGLSSCLSHGRSFRSVACLVVVLLGSLTAWDMIRLHPYQTVYFNRAVAGGLKNAAEQYETDYWGSSYKAGVEWLAENYPQPGKRRVRLANYGFGDPRQLTYYLERLENGSRFQVQESGVPPDVVLITRKRNGFKSINGRLLHTIDRMDTPLLFVFETRRPPTQP